MKKIILATIAAVALLLAAPGQSHAAQTGTQVTVTQMIVENDGTFAAWFSDKICTDVGAQQNVGQAAIGQPAGTNADGLRAMISVLEAAKLSGRKVSLETTGFTWGCLVKSVTVY